MARRQASGGKRQQAQQRAAHQHAHDHHIAVAPCRDAPHGMHALSHRQGMETNGEGGHGIGDRAQLL
jgi:hypothetical protein